MKKTLMIVGSTFMLFMFCASRVHAEPTDNTYVYITRYGGVWHANRNCGEIADNEAWLITYGEAKKLSQIDGECQRCANGDELSDHVIKDTYKYNRGFSKNEKINWKDYISNTEPSNQSDTNSTDDATEEGNSTKSPAVSTTTVAQTNTNNRNNTNSNSNSSPQGKELMTEKQRRNRFISQTNPARGVKPVTIPRPINAGFYYADFATYNSYNSENNLGGTPIYLLGTIMDIQPVKQAGSQYGLAVMVNDCDGYQWYMRCNCDQSKLALLKAELMGKAGNIFGTYAGYSGVTNRPMMDMTMVFEIPGNAVNMALYL